jgi:CubicO group peptidase (beta-lactamase class C family)
LIWGRGYGKASLETGEAATLDTRYRIASITKTFTATAIMQLCDAGALRLDDPVSQYLDWFNLRYDDAPPVTLYHLLTHTSGLPRDATVPHWTENEFQTWDELVETTQTRQPTMPPLQDISYSNLGYSLLGGVIETVSGLSWADYIRQHIVEPLGMTDTVVYPTGELERMAVGYLRRGDDYTRAALPLIETGGFAPSASMASSVNDLVKYAKFHLSKGQTPLLSGYSLRQMHRPHWVYDDWQSAYGLGIRVWRMDEYVVTGHTGGYKGYLTMFSVCRDHDFGVILLTNSLDSKPDALVERAYKLVLTEVLKITTETTEPDDLWHTFTGTYIGDWGDMEVVIRDNELQGVFLDDVTAPPEQYLPTDDPYTFTINIQGNPGETARFEVNEAGQVVKFWRRNEYMIPANE